MKYRVTKSIAKQFGNKSTIYIIEKKTWLGFYWPTDMYYYFESAANKRCFILNHTK